MCFDFSYASIFVWLNFDGFIFMWSDFSCASIFRVLRFFVCFDFSDWCAYGKIKLRRMFWRQNEEAGTMMYGLEAVTVRPGLLVIKSARAQLTLLALLWRPDALPRDAERWYGLKILQSFALCLIACREHWLGDCSLHLLKTDSFVV